MILHCGGRTASIDEVANVTTPPSTRTHYPLPHLDFVQRTSMALTSQGYRIVNQSHALAKGGDRYFGVFEIALDSAPSGGEYGWILGLRNSHDKAYKAGIVAGSRVFVCDNLAFSGQVSISRVHTRYCSRDLIHLTSRAISKINDHFGLMNKRVEAYKNHEIKDRVAHDLIIRAVDNRAIMPKDIPHVLQEWRKPSHEDFGPRNAWSLFNAFTENHKRIGTPSTLVKRSEALHGLFDAQVGVC